MSLRLSVIVPATNDPPTLANCLAAIGAADEPPEQFVVVREPPGAGPAEARNLGAAGAGGDVLVFVDADVAVHPDAFRRIRAAFAADPGLTAVFGSYDDDPPAPGAVSGFRNLLHHHVHQGSPGPAGTFWAGLGAVRRDSFSEAGGFDSARYPRSSIEDVELGIRLAEAGGRIVLDPELQGTHLKAWRLADMVRTDFARRGVPWVELLLEGRGSRSALNLGARHRASVAAAIALAAGLATRRPRVVVPSALALLVLNRSFYALLARRRGPGQAAAGVGLHALHHLVSAAALAAGVAANLTRRSRARRAGR